MIYLSLMDFQQGALMIAAIVLICLPLIGLAILEILRKKSSRPINYRLYLPAITALLLYFGAIYGYFFHDQFYWAQVADSKLTLEYELPSRSIEVPLEQIEEYRFEECGLLNIRMYRTLIITQEETYRSARFFERENRQGWLETYLPPIYQADHE